MGNTIASLFSYRNIAQEVSDVDLKLQFFENTTYDGHVIWKINDLKERIRSAKNNEITALHSAPLFTDKYGYKFCMRLYLNGNDDSIGKYLSIYFVLMKSEYDSRLTWPFNKGKGDVADHEDIIEINDSNSYDRPTKEMNIGIGCGQFISLAEVDKYIDENSLYFEMKITDE